MKRLVFVVILQCAVFGALSRYPVAIAAEVTDATGRTVTIPDHIERILPAGPPAAVLLAAIAPTQMLGFPGPPSEEGRTALAPEVSGLPTVPRLTGHPDMTPALRDLRPDLIIDYGNVAPRYKQLAQDTQQATGIPTLLFDGALDQIPTVARTLGKILHQPDRAEAVARFAEAILALPIPPDSHPRVLYARGADGLLVAAPGTDVTAIFPRLGWQVVAPDGTGTFRPSTVEAIRALDPDVIILADAAAKDLLTTAPWASLRAVRDGHAYIAPSIPFGWVEEPPSINRLLGVAWLRGGDPLTLAALFNASVYGRALTREQLLTVAGGTARIPPSWPGVAEPSMAATAGQPPQHSKSSASPPAAATKP
jgi:iron complex transport system substrate-binding protein